MADSCCAPPRLNLDPHQGNSGYRRILWTVLAINLAMFLVEIGAGLAAGSASLQADALDFFGDAANYAISLVVVGMALPYRASAALAKGATMGLFGLWIIGTVVWHAMHGTLPSALTMGAVGIAALVANAASFGLLWAYRGGDANMRSAWICTRNDVLGNFAVLLAAIGVFGTGTGWPDITVAAIMATLALQGAAVVIRQSLAELRQPVVLPVNSGPPSGRMHSRQSSHAREGIPYEHGARPGALYGKVGNHPQRSNRSILGRSLQRQRHHTVHGDCRGRPRGFQ
jgi:Co/Zn/Cd efflux system component